MDERKNNNGSCFSEDEMVDLFMYGYFDDDDESEDSSNELSSYDDDDLF